MNNCPNCNSFVKEDNSFCNSCGTKLKGLPEKKPQEKVTSKKTKKINILKSESNHWKELKDNILFYALLMLNSVVFYFVVRLYGNNPKYELYYWAIDLILIFYMFLQYKRNIGTLLAFRIPTPREFTNVLVCILFTGIFIKSYFGILNYFNWPMASYGDNIEKYGWPLWSGYIMTALLPGVLEEISFRGIIFNSLEKIMSKKEALIIQAACFSILHLSPIIIISHFVMGLLLGWVRVRTGNLYYGMVIHIMWNAYVISNNL